MQLLQKSLRSGAGNIVQNVQGIDNNQGPTTKVKKSTLLFNTKEPNAIPRTATTTIYLERQTIPGTYMVDLIQAHCINSQFSPL